MNEPSALSYVPNDFSVLNYFVDFLEYIEIL